MSLTAARVLDGIPGLEMDYNDNIKTFGQDLFVKESRTFDFKVDPTCNFCMST